MASRHVQPFLPKSDWSLDLLVSWVLWWLSFVVLAVDVVVVVVVRICDLWSPDLGAFVLFPAFAVREVISEMIDSADIGGGNWCARQIRHRMACACRPIS